MMFNAKKFTPGFTPLAPFRNLFLTGLEIAGSKKHYFKKRKFLTGFTLLEVIFAVTIILIAVIAIFGLVNLGVKNISVAKNKLIASELAQEGVELVRWWREDGHVDTWTDWYTGCQDASHTYVNLSSNPDQICGNFRFGVKPSDPAVVDITYNNIPAWGGAMPQIGAQINTISDIGGAFFQLWYDSSTKLYNHNGGGQSTNFFRIINISSSVDEPPPNGGKYKLVTVQVIWQDRAGLKSVQVYDKLYNWMAP